MHIIIKIMSIQMNKQLNASAFPLKVPQMWNTSIYSHPHTYTSYKKI